MFYYSRKLSPAETRYTTRKGEYLAVKDCLAEWRHYLLGAPFTVGSDHQSLQWLRVSTQNVAKLSNWLLQWLEFFSLFDFVQEYLPGQENVLPYYLSRPPVEVLLVTETGAHEQLIYLRWLSCCIKANRQPRGIYQCGLCWKSPGCRRSCIPLSGLCKLQIPSWRK